MTTALTQSEQFPSGMETFHTDESAPLDECLRRVREADFYVLLVGFRYGESIPDGSISFTEAEYDAAVAESKVRHLPLRFYFLSDSAPLTAYTIKDSDVDRSAVNAFRDRVSSNHVVEFVSSPADLSTKVLSGLLAARRPGEVDIQALSTSLSLAALRLPTWLAIAEDVHLRPEAVVEAANAFAADSGEGSAEHTPSPISDLITGWSSSILTGNAGIGKSTILHALSVLLGRNNRLATVINGSDLYNLKKLRPELSSAELLAHSVAIRLDVPSAAQPNVVAESAPRTRHLSHRPM